MKGKRHIKVTEMIENETCMIDVWKGKAGVHGRYQKLLYNLL